MSPQNSEENIAMDTNFKEKPLSPFQLSWRQLKGNRLAMFGGYVLILLYLCAIFAGFVAPYGIDDQNRRQPFFFVNHPPMKIHLFTPEGRLMRPFVYGAKVKDLQKRTYEEDTSRIYPIQFFVKGTTYSLFWGAFSWDRHLFGVDPEARILLFGTDRYGRDIFSRIFYGSQVSLSVGLVGILLTFTLGMFIGGISGFFGGWVDNLLLRFCEIIMSIPQLYLLLALAGVLPTDLPSDQKYFLIIVILSFVGWAGLARVIRGMVLSIKTNDFVLAAQALGAGTLRIVIRHVLPNTFSYVIIAATITVPFYILGEVSLSFLGVGIKPPQTSWGLMLSEAQQIQVLKYYPWILLPGFFIFLTVMAFNFLGDGLRDAFDPKKT